MLESHSAVREAALLALDETAAAAFGFEAGFCGVVRLVPELDGGNPLLEVELLAYCRARLSQAKCPWFVLFVRTLPRLPSGALDLAGLAGLVVSELDVAVPLA